MRLTEYTEEVQKAITKAVKNLEEELTKFFSSENKKSIEKKQKSLKQRNAEISDEELNKVSSDYMAPIPLPVKIAVSIFDDAIEVFATDNIRPARSSKKYALYKGRLTPVTTGVEIKMAIVKFDSVLKIKENRKLRLPRFVSRILKSAFLPSFRRIATKERIRKSFEKAKLNATSGTGESR